MTSKVELQNTKANAILVILDKDLWLSPNVDWFPERWPPAGFNHVASGLEEDGEEQWAEAPYLHPVEVTRFRFSTPRR